jgi:CheY-like chemotaxis protein
MAGADCSRVVLVVDDDPSIRESLVDLLDEEGYRVETAANGSEALEKLRERAAPRPCLILLDLMMPVMNGQQFYAEQQRDPALASIPTVVVTADDKGGATAGRLGAPFLAKPVRLDTLLEVIAKHCGRPAS